MLLSLPRVALGQKDISQNITFDKPYYSTTDTLNLTFVINNHSPKILQNNRVTVWIYNQILDNEDIFKLNLNYRHAFFRRSWYPNLPPGEYKQTISRRLPYYRLAEGVYPVRIRTELSDGRQFEAISYLVVLNSNHPPLKTLVVWSIELPITVDVRGNFRSHLLEENLRNSPKGKLRQLLDSITAHDKVAVNLAISPLLLQSIEQLTEGYKLLEDGKVINVPASSLPSQDAKSILNLFQSLSALDRVEIFSMPLASPILPWLVGRGWYKDLRQQLSKGQVVIKKTLKSSQEPSGFYPPQLVLDNRSASWLAKNETAKYALISSRYLAKDKPNSSIYVLNKKPGALKLFAPDADLSKMLSKANNATLSNKLIAILALKLLRRENNGKQLVVVTNKPGYLQSTSFDTLLSILQDIPWLESTSANLASQNIPVKKTRLRKFSPNFSRDSKKYLRSIASKRLEFLALSSALEQKNPLVNKIMTAWLRAESSYWILNNPEFAQSKGLRGNYLEFISQTSRKLFSRIKIKQTKKIILSNNQGKIPIAITNSNLFPVHLRLLLKGKAFQVLDDNNSEIALMPRENLFTYKIKVSKATNSFLIAKLLAGDKKIAEKRIEVAVSNNIRYLLIAIGVLVMIIAAMLFTSEKRRR
jgi:hypothetical protein